MAFEDSSDCNCSAISPSTSQRYGNGRVGRLFWIFTALPSTILILYTWIAGRLSPLAVGIYLLIVLLGLAGLVVLGGRLWLVRLTIVLGSLNLAVVAPELALRANDYHTTSMVSYGGLHPEFHTYFEPDSDLMWTYRRDQPGVNSFGFRGPELDTLKPAGRRRLLFIGDSCADQDYASVLEEMLNYQGSSGQMEHECIILAVPGYSSYQGKKIAEKFSHLLKADMAFVCFGWNDHWLAYGAADAERGSGWANAWCRDLYRFSRLLQLVFDYVHVGDRPPDRAVNKLRVSPEQFRENLAAIKQELAKAGTSTVFVTAPTGYGTRGVPAYLVEQQLAVDTTAVLTLHRQYADIVREAAKATGADLLDLERSLKGVERHRDLFMTDGIHFTQLGLEEVAVQMYGYLRRAWPPAQVKDGNL